MATKTKKVLKATDPKGKIKKSVQNIRDECDDIEDNIEEKNADTYGDPVVILD